MAIDSSCFAPSLAYVFHELEMPLIRVLMHMEQRGCLLESDHLHKVASMVQKRITELTEEIFALAGQSFNLNSGQQLGGILFGKLGLKPVRKTKTGHSTDAKTLERLRDQHPIITLLLEYRHYEKLLSTYILPLPELVYPTTGRVHTSFNQSITTTGRLSSSRPNLQNIPTRTELGMEIRKAFVAPEGYVLAGFDYSQIELRLMAHFAQDQKMIADFAAGRDIHAATAMRVFKLDALEDVTSSQRSIAKAVNFATLYGAGARTLAENAGVSYEEARSFMEEYFQEYPTVSQYIEQLVETAKQKGYAETMFGRRLSLPDLQSKMPQVQKAAERIAVNMPLQGTAADIMKKAMISVCDFVEQRTPDVWIILQVHDDLVLEIKEDRADELIPQIQQLIEADMHLSVPLQVDVKVGKNWGVMEKRSR